MWRRNGLSIVLFLLFLLCLVGQSASGWKEYNEERSEHGENEVPKPVHAPHSRTGSC